MSTEKEKFKLFVVVDPNDDEPHALLRAITTCRVRTDQQMELLIFIAVDQEAINTRANNDNLFRNQQWFHETIFKPLEDAGIDFQIAVSWSSEWQESIVQEVRRFSADMIYIPLHEKSNKIRFTFSESKWDLLKTANCPVVLIRPGSSSEYKTILAAVNFQALKPHQKDLNAKILDVAKTAAAHHKSDLHVVNGYLDSMHYPDRGRLANDTGLDSSHIHVQQGYTSEIVAEVANKIGADLVIMGTLGQTGKTRTRRGNTAERVISGLDIDTAVIN